MNLTIKLLIAVLSMFLFINFCKPSNTKKLVDVKTKKIKHSEHLFIISQIVNN